MAASRSPTKKLAPKRKAGVSDGAGKPKKIAKATRSNQERDSLRDERFLLVLVGASAGGLDALSELFSGLGADFNGCLVVAQHMSPQHASLLAQLLSRQTTMVVKDLKRRTRFKPGHAYIVPPNRDVEIDGLSAVPVKPEGARGPRPSVNRLFSSVHQYAGGAVSAVILSGTGSDGAQGAQHVADTGGHVFVQDEASAKYAGMPEAAASAVPNATIFAPQAMAVALRHLSESGELPEAVKARTDETLVSDQIADLLRTAVDFDISLYKDSTVSRRIQMRMATTGCGTIEAYAELLNSEPEEVVALRDALLIQVTSFFRDPEAFEDLRPHLAKLMERAKAENQVIRIWVPGCSTGEEAYSLAIMCDEIRRRTKASLPVQIFATDLNEHATDLARKGRFAVEALVDMPPERQESYFTEVENGFEISRQIRDMVVFARHDLLRSAPFLHLSLISCRNLIMYFESRGQDAALLTFARALEVGGLLFLGKSEAIAKQSIGFEKVSETSRIYRRLQDLDTQRELATVMPTAYARVRQRVVPAPKQPSSPSQVLRETIAAQFMPPSVLIDGQNRVVYSVGEMNQLIEVSEGPFPGHIEGLLPAALRPVVSAQVIKARKSGQVCRGRARTELSDEERDVWEIVCQPAHVPGSAPSTKPDYIAVSFVRQSMPILSEAAVRNDRESVSGENSEVVQVLEHELAATREHLQTVIEELETSNEELQASNEELQSSNEELQATNEELQTSNEQLNSANEELITLNEELGSKSTELSAANEDLRNIQNSIESLVLVLDNHMRLIRWNDHAARTLGLDHHNYGGPFKDVALLGAIPRLEARVNAATESKATVHLQADIAGRDFAIAISPYLHSTVHSAAVVVVLTDNTEFMHVQRALKEREGRLIQVEGRQRATLDGLASHVALIDESGTIISVNKAWENFAADNGVSGSQTGFGVGSNYIELCSMATGPCSDEAAAVAKGLVQVIKRELGHFSIEYPCHSPDQERWFECVIVPVDVEGGKGATITHTDITQQHVAARLAMAARDRALSLNHARSQFVARVSHELRTPLNAIGGFTDMIRNEVLGPIGHERYASYLDDISFSAHHLQSIVEDIVNFARFENGSIVVNNEQTDVAELILRVMRIVNQSHAGTGVRLANRFEDNLPEVETDVTLFTQALINLMDNACKFTDRNTRVEIVARTSGNDELIIDVSDNGPGVPEDLRDMIFEPFGQVHSVQESSPTGLGLGLNIVRAIMELLGGSVELIEAGPAGSTFRLSLPLVARDKPEQKIH